MKRYPNLDRAADRIAAARIVARAIIDGRQRAKRMAGGEFFALIDEMDGSEHRLDALAKPVLEKLALLEGRATIAIQGKHAKLDAAIDYVDRMETTTKKLEEGAKATNGGPTVQGSEVSPKPSPAALQSSVVTPSAVAPLSTVLPVDPPRNERAPSDYLVTNGRGQ